MQSPDHHRAARQAHGRVGLIRGLLVIVTALAIGGFMVVRGLDPDRNGGGELAAGNGPAGGDPAVSSTDPTADAEGDGPAPSDPSATAAGATDGTTTTAGVVGNGVSDGDNGSDTSVAAPAGPEVGGQGDVEVLVLNAAGAKGVAGRGSEILKLAGYDVLAPRNADFLGPSQILYAEGFEVQARAVAEVFGADPADVVAALDPADKPISDTRGADIVVVVGKDGLIDV